MHYAVDPRDWWNPINTPDHLREIALIQISQAQRTNAMMTKSQMQKAAETGKTAHFVSDFWLDWSLPETKGRIVHVYRDAEGLATSVYVAVAGQFVNADEKALLTIV